MATLDDSLCWSNGRDCTGRAASGRSADAMLPVHEESPCRIFLHNPAGPAQWLMSESARHSYFRRKCCSLSASQRLYGQHHNLYYMLLFPRNWMTNGPRTRSCIENARLTFDDRERLPVQPSAANARRGRSRSGASASRDGRNGQVICLKRGGCCAELRLLPAWRIRFNHGGPVRGRDDRGCGARATCPNCQYIPTRT